MSKYYDSKYFGNWLSEDEYKEITEGYFDIVNSPRENIKEYQKDRVFCLVLLAGGMVLFSIFGTTGYYFVAS